MNRVRNIIIILISIISLVPILHLAIYSRPCSDDYSYSYSTHKIVMNNNKDIYGLIKEAIRIDIHFYNHWQGLYTSAFILSLQPSIFGEKYYFIGSWILILFMFFCLYFFLKTVFNDLLHIKENALPSTFILLSIILARIPNIVQGLYWFNGAWNYIPFLFLTLLNIALMIRYYKRDDKKYLIISIILSFIISGGNHVTSFLNILLLIVFNLFIFRKNKKCILPLITAIIGFIIMYIAPGTSVRQTTEVAQPVLTTMIMSIKGLYLYYCNWNSLYWFLLLIASIITGYLIKQKTDLKKENLKVNPIILLTIALIVLCGMFCVPYKAMGFYGEGRLTNVIWITFIILSIIITIYTTMWILYRINLKINFYKISNVLLILILTTIIFFDNSNSLKAKEQIKNGSAKLFAEQNDIRYKQMKKNK